MFNELCKLNNTEAVFNYWKLLNGFTNLLPSPNFFVVAKSSHPGLFRFELFLEKAQQI